MGERTADVGTETGGQAASAAPFGTVIAPTMAVANFADGAFSVPELRPVAALTLHPAAHALHYGSACFEGMKAHRGVDGIVRLFRADRHVERMRQSADALCLAVPDSALLAGMIRDTVTANLAHVPEPPGSLYVRPVLIGTEPNIGAAAAPSAEGLLYVLTSPVGDYFAGGLKALTLAVETELPRTTPLFGRVKSGANYVMALKVTQEAMREFGANQVLFAPNGDVQETGAANFLLIDDERVVTKGLDDSFLHGVTRDSILALARDLGYRVEERDLSVDELVDWAGHGEAALAGTAAVMSGVGTLVHKGQRVTMGSGEVGPNTLRLRDALLAIQRAQATDAHGWTQPL